MKQCPKCQRTYDETLSFCLQDGTVLSSGYDPEETLVKPLPKTILLPLTPKPATSSPQRSSSHRVLYAVILVLAIFATGITVAWFYERNKAIPPESSDRQAGLSPARDTTTAAAPVPVISPSPLPLQNPDRYTVTPCRSIQDLRTNLEWYVGPDRNMTWYEAQLWTTNLGSCGGGWRMPTIEEIRTLHNPATRAGTGFYTDGKYFPAHIDPVFEAIGGGSWVWSDQQVPPSNARSFNLNQGKVVEYSASNTDYSTRAFAVRALRN